MVVSTAELGGGGAGLRGTCVGARDQARGVVHVGERAVETSLEKKIWELTRTVRYGTPARAHGYRLPAGAWSGAGRTGAARTQLPTLSYQHRTGDDQPGRA